VEFTQADEDLFTTVKKELNIKRDADVFRTLLLDRVMSLLVKEPSPQISVPPAEKITDILPPGFSKTMTHEEASIKVFQRNVFNK
jgi:hypothetical protein